MVTGIKGKERKGLEMKRGVGVWIKKSKPSSEQTDVLAVANEQAEVIVMDDEQAEGNVDKGKERKGMEGSVTVKRSK